MRILASVALFLIGCGVIAWSYVDAFMGFVRDVEQKAMAGRRRRGCEHDYRVCDERRNPAANGCLFPWAFDYCAFHRQSHWKAAEPMTSDILF